MEGLKNKNLKIGNSSDNGRDDVWFLKREGEGKRGEE